MLCFMSCRSSSLYYEGLQHNSSSSTVEVINRRKAVTQSAMFCAVRFTSSCNQLPCVLHNHIRKQGNLALLCFQMRRRRRSRSPGLPHPLPQTCWSRGAEFPPTINQQGAGIGCSRTRLLQSMGEVRRRALSHSLPSGSNYWQAW